MNVNKYQNVGKFNIKKFYLVMQIIGCTHLMARFILCFILYTFNKLFMSVSTDLYIHKLYKYIISIFNSESTMCNSNTLTANRAMLLETASPSQKSD